MLSHRSQLRISPARPLAHLTAAKSKVTPINTLLLQAKSSDLALPKLAKALGVRVEDLLGSAPIATPGRPGPVGKLRRALEQAAVLPRRQQQLVVEFVNTLVHRQKRAS